jgi:hypothetical protein
MRRQAARKLSGAAAYLKRPVAATGDVPQQEIVIVAVLTPSLIVREQGYAVKFSLDGRGGICHGLYYALGEGL